MNGAGEFKIMNSLIIIPDENMFVVSTADNLLHKG
jgi:hypothetical protein